ncbi:MAG: hypothetical protein JOZ18_22810, partial [Chloroflexi bacterium]|nr:hypothetical protein [Chloroflexota bacterium]
MQHTDQSIKQDKQSPAPSAINYSKLLIALFALGAGLLASVMAVVLMGVLRLAAGIPTPVELFGDFLLKHISVDTFIRLLITFSPNSKTAPLGLALLGMIGLGTVLGLLYAVLVRVQIPVAGYQLTWRECLTALAFAEAMSLIAIVLFWDELRQNFFGLPVDWARFVTALGLFAVFNLYGLTLSLAYHVLLPKQPTPGVAPAVQSRRLLLSRAGVAALGMGGIAGTAGLIRSYLNNYTAYDGMKSAIHNNVTPPITPNNEHYVVTQ